MNAYLHRMELPKPVRDGFAGRQPWSVYRLPVWNVEKPEPKKPAFPVAHSRELANIRKAKGLTL